jgi:hypothetical protein
MKLVANRTNAFIDYVNSRVVGRRVDQGYMTFIDHVREGVGYKIDATGDATIHTCTASEGHAEKLEVPGRPEFNIWDCNLKFTYRYNSNTKGNKQIFAFGGMTGEHVEWGNLSPEGTVMVTYISIPGDQARITFQFLVDADHEDNPGHFIRDHVVTHFKSLFIQFGQEFTGTTIREDFMPEIETLATVGSQSLEFESYIDS